MFIIGIALFVVAAVFWLVAMNFGKQQRMYDHHRFERGVKDDEEDEAMMLRDIKALNSFAKTLRTIGVACAVLGFVVFWI